MLGRVPHNSFGLATRTFRHPKRCTATCGGFIGKAGRIDTILCTSSTSIGVRRVNSRTHHLSLSSSSIAIKGSRLCVPGAVTKTTTCFGEELCGGRIIASARSGSTSLEVKLGYAASCGNC